MLTVYTSSICLSLITLTQCLQVNANSVHHAYTTQADHLLFLEKTDVYTCIHVNNRGRSIEVISASMWRTGTGHKLL
jgi:hypothetical protein